MSRQLNCSDTSNGEKSQQAYKTSHEKLLSDNYVVTRHALFIVPSSKINTIVSQSLRLLLSAQRSQGHVGVNVHVTHT